MITYRGSCHCGAVRFTFQSEPITRACRCNCSICTKKGAIMSIPYYAPDAITIEGIDSLNTYRWGDKMVNNYFCRQCGIHPFHDTTIKPGHYRVNLSCVDGLDCGALAVDWIDGRSF